MHLRPVVWHLRIFAVVAAALVGARASAQQAGPAAPEGGQGAYGSGTGAQSAFESRPGMGGQALGESGSGPGVQAQGGIPAGGSGVGQAGSGAGAGAQGPAGVPARLIPGAVCVVPATSSAPAPAPTAGFGTAPASGNAAATGTGGFGAGGTPAQPTAGVPAVGRDPCVQLVACYARLSETLCAPGARACHRAFAVDTARSPESCRALLTDAGLRAAPFAGASFTVPEACVE